MDVARAWYTNLVLIIICRFGLCDIIDYMHGTIIDLTHPFDNKTLYYNGKMEFNLTTLLKLKADKYIIDMNSISTFEHGGTHIDAPSHFVEGGGYIGDVPLKNLIGPAAVIRVAEKVKTNPLYEVTVEDIMNWEQTHKQLPPRTILMLDFGWSEKWGDSTKFFGTDNLADSNNRAYPGLHPDAARWLVDNRPNINAVATETCCIDYGPTKDFATHTTLLKNGILILENVKDIHKVEDFATIFAIPMKIQKGTGAPLRIFALTTEDNNMQNWVSGNIPLFTIGIAAVCFFFMYIRGR